ncbi:MAG: hypothetical protein JJU33_04925 [Phycisphaerales bacterium]|nr:hypothetical protein [Phycisphaerales bacterium]
MRTERISVLRAAAMGLLGAVSCGVALGSPEFHTVVLDDFSGFERDQRWTAQIGSGGHVAYLTRSDAQLRLWDGTATEVLHEIGTHLEGLAPGVTTDSLTPSTFGSRHHGRILGVDREGGVSVLLYAGPEPSESTSVLASTVLGGGFRAIMVPPEFAAQTGVVRSVVWPPFFGMRRSDAGYTRASGTDEDGVFSHSVFSPDLSQSVLWSRGDQIPGGTTAAGLTFLLGDFSFGIAGHYDHAGSGSAADLVHFTADGGQTFDNGVLRTRGTGAEMLLRSGATINGLQLAPGGRPLVRVNEAGQTLVAIERVFDPDLGTLIFEPLLLYGETGEPERLLQRNESISFANFQPRPYNPPWSDRIHRRIALGNDGSAIFDITGGSDEIAHRSPSGVYTMLLARNAELLGVPGATVGTDIRPIVSLDATSAAGVYRVDGVDTVFHATPAGVTRIVGAGDEVEVAPGVFQTVLSVYLLDVNAEHLLFNMTFAGGRAMIAATVPTCPADLNNDGVVDADDFFLFLHFFAAGDPRADINNDGVIDADDFFDYLNLFAQGC